MKLEVTKRIEFECCYIYEGEINAHRYKLEVTVSGPQRMVDNGVVISFEDFNKYLRELVPHKAYLYSTKNHVGSSVAQSFIQHHLEVRAFSFDLSAENLCNFFATTLQDILNLREPGLIVTDMKLREDNNSFVSWQPTK